MPEQAGVTPEGYTTVAPWVITDDTGAFQLANHLTHRCQPAAWNPRPPA